jgi:hypothetical protein
MTATPPDRETAKVRQDEQARNARHLIGAAISLIALVTRKIQDPSSKTHRECKTHRE